MVERCNMKRKEKILFCCKECGVVLGCHNIFSKDESIPCDQCKVADNCTMRVAPLKYANNFTIEQDAWCDKCFEKKELK